MHQAIRVIESDYMINLENTSVSSLPITFTPSGESIRAALALLEEKEIPQYFKEATFSQKIRIAREAASLQNEVKKNPTRLEALISELASVLLPYSANHALLHELAGFKVDAVTGALLFPNAATSPESPAQSLAHAE